MSHENVTTADEVAADATSTLRALDGFRLLVDRYIALSGESQVRFGINAGVGHDFVNRIGRPGRRPSVRTMEKAAGYIASKCATAV